jgi:hypothetical protein
MRPLSRRFAVLGILAALIAVLGGGVLAQSTPTGTPGPGLEPTTSATLEPGEVTAGQIADQIAAAWASVHSYRTVSVVIPDAGTPEPSPVAGEPASAERTVILPDTKRLVVRDASGTTEIVLSGGVLAKRVTPVNGQPGAWETVDLSNVGENDPLRQTYTSMLGPEHPPYSGLSNRQRERIGTETGTAEINGRACTGYLFPEVTETGEVVKVFIYLDATDLPCRIETQTTALSRTDFFFNETLTIATPAAVGTPEPSPTA